jgi:hypothetical protein
MDESKNNKGNKQQGLHSSVYFMSMPFFLKVKKGSPDVCNLSAGALILFPYYALFCPN